MTLAVLLTAIVAMTSSRAGGSGSELATPARRASIVGGDIVSDGEFPAVVAIHYGSKLCSGTLVAPQLVLTAAHCLAQPGPSWSSGLEVAFGERIGAPAQTAMATDFGASPDFCPSCLYERNDIGYVVLPAGLQIPAELPSVITHQHDWDYAIGDGRPLLMVGFGSIEDASSDGIGAKRYVGTTMRRHGESGLDFLAGSPGIDTCEGDSGGPGMVVLEDGRLAVAGVLSGGLGPCGSGESVYSVPFPVLTWIGDESGIELLPPECNEGDCLDTASEPEGCDCAAADRRVPWWTLLVVLAVWGTPARGLQPGDVACNSTTRVSRNVELLGLQPGDSS